MAAKNLVIHSFISKAIGVCCGVLAVVLTSRWLGAEIRGEISFLLSWIGAWVIVSDFVTGSALINLSAKYPAKQLWAFALKWVVFLSCFVLLFYLIFPLNQSAYSIVIPIALLLMGVFNTHGAILIGKGKLNARNYAFALVPFLSITGFAVFALVKGVSNIGVREYFLCLLAAWLLADLFTFMRLKLFADCSIKPKGSKELSKVIFKNGALSQSGHLIQFIATRLPFFLMPLLFGMENLGVFSNVVVLGEGVLIIAASLGQILHAKIIHSKNPADDIPDVLKYARLSLLCVIPVVLVLIFIPDEFWIWLLKKEFAGLGTMFLLFSPMVLLQSISSIISHFYHAANRFVVLIVANAIGALVGFAGFMILSHYFGVNGFVLGVVCGYCAQFLFLILKIKHDYQVKLYSLLPNKDSVKQILGLIS
ncbi:MAG: polysaccharide biosynthesis C-terminal domain-containing protein [Bacteroidia bacterium]|nr:polysaccharide biosynthesis C-terminal domain-containing protein [Bacteroidia bacterium]